MPSRVRLKVVGIALLAVWLAAGCGGERRPAAPTPPTGTISPLALAYLNELVAIMEAHSVNRLKIDWAAFRMTVVTAAGAAQSVQAASPAIQTALTLLGDGHSFYRPLNGFTVSAVTRTCSGATIGDVTLPDTVGYVRVGAFSGSAVEASAFANGLQRAIASADRDNLAGWIVDVRGNRGGNMWPMIAGVGPVLGGGRAGYFIDPVGAESWWEYRDGASWNDGAVMQRVETPYRLRHDSPKVAVLIDNGTASSGEAVLIAFQRRQNTRTFGNFTCGLSTANEEYVLSDGASLFLTVSTMADRTKALYGGQIGPDEEIVSPREVEQRAVAWLHAR